MRRWWFALLEETDMATLTMPTHSAEEVREVIGELESVISSRRNFNQITHNDSLWRAIGFMLKKYADTLQTHKS